MSDQEFESKMEEGLQLTYKRLVEQKRRNNDKLIFSENGQIVYADPFSLEV